MMNNSVISRTVIWLFIFLQVGVCMGSPFTSIFDADNIHQNPKIEGISKIYLADNIPLAFQITKANTIYVIQYDFILSSDINIPKGCVLEFDGGSINGSYTIKGDNTAIHAGLKKIFDKNIVLSGTWNVNEAYPEWFGTVHDDNNSTCAALAINKCFSLCDKVVLPNSGTYYATTNEQIVVKGCMEGVLRGGVYNTNEPIGTYLHFKKSAPVDGSYIRIGERVSTSSYNRSQSCSIKNIYLETHNLQTIQTAVLEIGSVSECRIVDVYINNRSRKSSEFTEKEIVDPIKNCNYGIRITGLDGTNSEFLYIENSHIFADIPLYIQRGVDFMRISNTRFVCNDYGFSSIYGDGLGSAVLFDQISFNQGLYGIYAINVSNNITIDAFRIEQLRETVIKREKHGCNIFIDGANNNSQRCFLSFNNGYFAPNNGIKLKGFKLNRGLAPATIVFNRCCNTTQSTERYDYLIDLSECEDYVKFECKDCSLTGGKVILNPNMQIKGNRERSQTATSFYPSCIENLETESYPSITGINNLRSYRYKRESLGELSADVFQTLTPISITQTVPNEKTPKVKCIVTREDDNYAKNATYAYKIEVECFGVGVYGKAVFVRNYVTTFDNLGSIKSIKVGKGSATIQNLIGNIFKYNTHSMGSITISDYGTEGGFAVFNHTGVEVTIRAKVTQFIDNSIFVNNS